MRLGIKIKRFIIHHSARTFASTQHAPCTRKPSVNFLCAPCNLEHLDFKIFHLKRTPSVRVVDSRMSLINQISLSTQHPLPIIGHHHQGWALLDGVVGPMFLYICRYCLPCPVRAWLRNGHPWTPVKDKFCDRRSFAVGQAGDQGSSWVQSHHIWKVAL